jgi:PEP-CTERM motif
MFKISKGSLRVSLLSNQPSLSSLSNKWILGLSLVGIFSVFGSLGTAQAQTLNSGSLVMPNATIGGVNVQGFAGSIPSASFLLPTAGNTVIFSNFNTTGIVSFANLPLIGSGSGSATGLTFPITLTLDGVVQTPVNITGSSYAYNAGPTSTTTQILPGAAQGFSYLGTNYSLTLDSVTLITGGNPSQVDISTIGGRITNLSSVGAPEPGTLMLLALGGIGIAAKRRRKA